MFWDTFRENWSSGNFLSKSPMDFFDQFFLNMTFLSVFAEKCCICLCFEVDFEKISLGLYFYRNRRSTSSIFFFRNKFLSMFAGKRRICLCFEIDSETIGLGWYVDRNRWCISSIQFPFKLKFLNIFAEKRLYMPMLWARVRENWSRTKFLSNSSMEFFDRFAFQN